MTEPADDTTTAAMPVDRRGIMRVGAVLAGAAGLTGLGAIASAPAHAADGDAVVAGQDNAAASTTSLTIGGTDGAAGPTLALHNANGPSVSLEALPPSWAGDLAIGDIAGSQLGPLVGVDTLSGPATTYLATGVDLANLPTPFPANPTRVLDLRTAAGRANILRTSTPTAVGADGKLAAGQWVDVAVAPTGPDYNLSAVFVNLTAVLPAAGGYASLYAPGARPQTSTLNYIKSQTLANGAFVATGVVLGNHTLRIYTSAPAWFLVDITGGVTSGALLPPIAQSAALRKAGGRQALISRVRAAVTQMSR